MADIYIKEDDTSDEVRSIEGSLRILRFNPDNKEENHLLFLQPFPNSEGVEAGLRVSVPELKHSVESSHDFDETITWLTKLERGDDAAPAPNKLFIPGHVDTFKMMKHTRDDAAAFSKLFHELADHLDTQIIQFDAWIKQEEQDRDVQYPHYMKAPEEDDE